MVRDVGVRWSEARLDQRNLPALRAAAKSAFEYFGDIDILFANAGIRSFKPILGWRMRTGMTRSTLIPLAPAIQSAPLRHISFKNGGGASYRHRLDSGQAWDEIRRSLFRIQMGHYRPHEVGGPRAWRIRHHGQCRRSRSDRYAAHKASPALRASSRRASGGSSNPG
jgi:NAD(P)-dependent dehydrogenase (short-subunit alcohol dehydrogenase family)